MEIKEVNLRRFVRGYLDYLENPTMVTRKGKIIGYWLPYESAVELFNQTQD